MKIREIFESLGAPKKRLPGAVKGISVMNPEEFADQDEEMDEAIKLSAPHRDFGGDELQAYAKRVRGTPDIDKKTGLPKVNKDRVNKKGKVTPGKEKYISGKTKSDKYKMPYVHRNSMLTYFDPEGQNVRPEAILTALKRRPEKLLKQNEKMKHSNGDFEQFFNIGFAALTGIAADEDENKLIIVNTCPGAGSCKVDCFAMGGGKIQFENAWLSDGKILTYLLNDPDGFFVQLDREIKKEVRLGQKGFKDETGAKSQYAITIRWHDAGDFFSPEYLELAFKIARANPEVKFYAYTKMANAALAVKPNNFIINWSEGAHTSQEKQVKAQDPELTTTKNSRIVPDNLFADLLLKDEYGRLIKKGRTYKQDVFDKQGRQAIDDEGTSWQIKPGQLPLLKQRLASVYGISPNSILSYDEYVSKPKIRGMKYNVIVAPGEGDISANDPSILSTLLLKH